MRSNRQKYGMFLVAAILTILSLVGFVHGQTPGTEKWHFATGWSVRSSPAIGADGTIYVGSDDHNLYAINPDGTEKWRFVTGDSVYSSPAIGADGTIYVGSRDYNLYAIHSTSPGVAHTPWPMFHHDLKHTGRVLAQAPLVDIKANGFDGPLTIPYGTNLTVTIALDPGVHPPV